MVIFMKISNTNTLGNRLMARNNERRMVKATGERFEMSKKDIINNGVNAKIVKDKMGMLMASQALGDEIASTIRTGMNICAINFAQFIGEDGTLGENAVHVALMYSGLYWKVWDRQTKTVNFEKAEKISSSLDLEKSGDGYYRGYSHNILQVMDYLGYAPTFKSDITLKNLIGFRRKK